ncbi:5-formyltetrahydrofolate cyclo-ligase [Cyanobium gracile]|uniref:5-formyltetrahydrofolate cyclo-ligase n=1 Tax=Cyanobium gracile (strain ATCC 27147 / PCC 6307) TaxID=292564 RepID=K9PCT6_CYAGP|nr:5-formyltetrahydrofolate cyclo-ligase [Cyanobium gracile]AFY30354.1 5,10-methenyltetrahydrofolate synthetase [Cyanobium gracile PCC 6307]
MEGSEKSQLRRRFRRTRRLSLPEATAGIVAVARRELPGRVPPGRHLGLYWPLTQEPDLRILAEQAPWPMALPAVRPGAGLIYLPWSPGDPLGPDACGIAAPLEGTPLEPETLALLLVPALAVSPAGLRLGSGGGWYDRLRADPRWRAVPALAVLPAACVAATLPLDPWDIPFSGWLDEEGLHWIGPAAENIATHEPTGPLKAVATALCQDQLSHPLRCWT